MEKLNDSILATKEKAPAVVAEQARAKYTNSDSNSTIKTKRGNANGAIKQAFKRGEWLTDWKAHQKTLNLRTFFQIFLKCQEDMEKEESRSFFQV